MIEVSKKFEIYWKHILQSRPNYFFRELVRAIELDNNFQKPTTYIKIVSFLKIIAKYGN